MQIQACTHASYFSNNELGLVPGLEGWGALSVKLSYPYKAERKNNMHSIFSGYILVQEIREKKIKLIRVWEVLVLAPFYIESPLYNSKKKDRSTYKVHGTQNDRLELTVSTQKSGLKYMHRVPRY